MNDKNVYGKRFSRRKNLGSVSHNDSPEKIREFITRQSPTAAATFENKILRWSHIAETILKENGFPYSGILRWYRVDENEKWKTERPANRKLIDIVLAPYIINNKRLRPYMIMDKQRAPSLYTPIATYGTMDTFLDEYIVKDLKKAHDSPEGLAARILTIIEELKNPHADKMTLACELGEVSTLLNTYGIAIKQRRNNASGDRKKEWAVNLAEYLVSQKPDLPNTRYWDEIPEGEELLHCYRHNEGGEDYLCYSKSGENDDRIKRITFRTEYITPVKKHYKKNNSLI